MSHYLNFNPVSGPTRFLFVDALRGIAALMVVLHHAPMSTVLGNVVQDTIPEGLDAFLKAGALGVPVFFILSGFIIPHSLRKNSLSFREVGNFMLRRQLRLDLPYWTALVLMIGLFLIETRILSLPSQANLNTVFLEFLYLQGIFNVPHDNLFLVVAWTLCLEIQFYLVLISLLLLGKKSKRIVPELCFTRLSVTLILISGIICLMIRPFYVETFWFFSHWPQFVLGTLSYLAWKKIVPLSYFLGYSSFFFLISLFVTADAPNNLNYMAMFSGLVIAYALYFSGTTNQMSEWGKSNVLQFLGRISYSLYLTHIFTFHVIQRAAYKLTGDNIFMAYIWGVISIVCAVAFANLFYLYVERPSLKLAERFKHKRAELAVTNDGLLTATS
jgi:peptidoglycan/LPS O-acetylase OafA/YrhL